MAVRCTVVLYACSVVRFVGVSFLGPQVQCESGAVKTKCVSLVVFVFVFDCVYLLRRSRRPSHVEGTRLLPSSQMPKWRYGPKWLRACGRGSVAVVVVVVVVVTLHVPWEGPCNLTRSVGKGRVTLHVPWEGPAVVVTLHVPWGGLLLCCCCVSTHAPRLVYKQYRSHKQCRS